MDTCNPEDPRDAVPPTVPLTKSYVHAACSVPLNGITVGEAIEAAAEKRPDHVAYVFSESGKQLTYEDLHKMICRAAKSYIALGLTKGDHVTIANIADENYLALVFGALFIGLVAHTPEYFIRPYEVDLQQIFTKVEPRAIFLNPGRNDVNYKALQQVVPNLDNYSLPTALQLEMFPQLKYVIIVTDARARAGLNITSFYRLGERITDEQLEQLKAEVTFNDKATLTMTSGTTGERKVVIRSHFSMVNTAKFSYMRQGVKHGDIIGVLNPVHEEMLPETCIWAAVDQDLEICLVLMPSILWDVYSNDYKEEDWKPEEMLRVIEKYRITHCDVYPHFWAKILERPGLVEKYDISSLARGCFTGTFLSEALIRNFSKLVPELTNGLGSTETYYTTITYPRDKNENHRYGTVGFPIAHTEVKLVDGDNKIVSIGQQGEICTRGFSVMLGYYKDEEQTRKVKEPSGWYHMGDIGVMDEYGFITFHGRKAHRLCYVSYATNVYPAPIEAIAESHPLVKEAQVVGFPNGAYGDHIVLCAVLGNGSKMAMDELKTHVENKLLEPYFPHSYLFMDSFPKHGQRQKVSKKVLADMARTMLIEKGEIKN